jgi:hypothetical protein
VSLQRLLGALEEHEVRFVVVGMVAGNLHGSGYLTEDLDIVYDTRLDNVERLCTAIAPFHPKVAETWPLEGSELQFRPSTLVAERSLTVLTDEGEIDMLHRIDGVGEYDDVVAISEVMVLEGRPISVISLRGLITTKRASGRDKDRLHLPELELIEELKRLAVDEDTPS